MHYEFEGWLGDDLLESTPVFIVSSNLVKGLKKSEFKDYKLEECLTTMSDVFKELYPNKELPYFTRFIPRGTVEIEGEHFNYWSGHHFCLSSKGELVVTKKALNFLKQFFIKYCDIKILTQS